MRKLLVNIARLILAVTFILSGFVKAVDPLGTQYKIADYLRAMHSALAVPDFVALTSSVLLSAVEFGLGICLLFAIRRRLITRLTLLMMAVMTPLTLWLAVANPISDCGCFGDAVTLTNWQTFGKNVVLTLLAITVWRWPFDMPRLVSRSSQWVVINHSALFIVILSGWSLYDLPYFDFRPYHIGTNLRDGWLKMMDGEESPYSDFFIEQIVAAEEKGAEDAEEEPPTDDAVSEDITEQVLSDSGYVFLLVAPHLEQADDSQLDLINQVYEYAEDYHYPFYCLTASNTKGIQLWKDVTGAEYPFCQTDDIVLKTVIRSNPGLLLLKDGIVIRKWSHNRLPDEYALNERLEKLEIGKMPEDSIPGKVLLIILWYVLPLTILVATDRLWAWSKGLRKKETDNKLYQHLTKKKKNEKEDCSRQLENEPEPAGGYRPRQGTE